MFTYSVKREHTWTIWVRQLINRYTGVIRVSFKIFESIFSLNVLPEVKSNALEREYAIMMLYHVCICSFESPKDPQYVEYVVFCDLIESVFTLKNLEKAPQVTPVQYQPPVEVDQNVLSPEADAILQPTMQRLAEKVCTGRETVHFCLATDTTLLFLSSEI